MLTHNLEESKEGGPPVERAVAAAEFRIGEDAAPALAGKRGPEVARGILRREAQEDVAEDVVRQLLRRRHGCCSEGILT